MLVEHFEQFKYAFFEANYWAVLNTLPELLGLAYFFNEPVWRLAIQYYAIPAHIYWCGDLARGLETATRGIIAAQGLKGNGSLLGLYVREMLLYAWLETDGPGYAAEVIEVLDELQPDSMGKDLAARFNMLRARALSQGESPKEAAQLMLAQLSYLDWPRPYHDNLRACAASWMGRLDEALIGYEAAQRGFDAMGFTIEGNEARLSLGATLLSMGENEKGLEVLRATHSAAAHTLNRAHVGMAEGAIGKALVQLGQHEAADRWFGSALERLEDLGWWRSEGEIALERLKAGHQLRQETDSDQREAWERDARRRIMRLRSNDLQDELESL